MAVPKNYNHKQFPDKYKEYWNLDKEKMKSLMRLPNIVDGRNVWNPQEMKDAGFRHIGIGRGNR